MEKETDQDAVVFTDENGEEITLHIVDYFLYNGDEYVILTDSDDEEEWEEEEEGESTCACCDDERDEPCRCEDDDGECECSPEEVDVYVMRVNVVDDENEEFVPIDPEQEDEILEYAEKFLNGELPDEAY
jgi:uncharacterized protein YrzB (UPF0473 family)